MDDNPTYGIDLEEEMMKVLAAEIAAELDFEVMSQVMIKSGWHKVVLDRFKNNNHAIDMKYWAEEYCKFGHFNHGTTFVFEDKGDAVNFTMKWA